MTTPSISVCIAAFNGAKFIEEQLHSIRAQLGAADEIIIVDDFSRDNTIDVVRGIGDSRIRIVASDANSGHVATFERALRQAGGDVILLSDQDDVWLPNRVALLTEALGTSRFAASNWRVLGGPGRNPVRVSPRDDGRWATNVIRIFRGNIPYFGCAMAMRSDARDLVLPFPKYTEAHDLWIALVANVGSNMRHLDEDTVERRLHSNNLTPVRRRGLWPVARTRLILARLFFVASSRMRRHRRDS